MALYGGGEPVKAVAYQLGISEETAKSYLKRIREKYRVAGLRRRHQGRAAEARHPGRHPAADRLTGRPSAPHPSRGGSGTARCRSGRAVDVSSAGPAGAPAPVRRLVRSGAQQRADRPREQHDLEQVAQLEHRDAERRRVDDAARSPRDRPAG